MAKWYSGTLGGLKLPDICPTGEEKPRKNFTQETCPDRGLNPGPLRDKRACYHLLHSSGRTCEWDLRKFGVIVCLVSRENLPAFIFKRLVCDQAGDDKYPRFQKYPNALLHANVTSIKETVYYIMIHGRLARWRKWRACDVGEAKEGLESELWRWWSNGERLEKELWRR